MVSDRAIVVACKDEPATPAYCRVSTCLAHLIVLTLSLFTSHSPAEDEHPSKAIFDRAWSHATLWRSADGESDFAVSGRLQADSYWVGADDSDLPPGADDSANDTLWRRFRFGFKAQIAGAFTLHLEGDFDLNSDREDFYNRMTDAYLGYDPGGDWSLKILKQSVAYTLDGATSSKRLLTLERNNLTNNLWATDEYFSGLQVKGAVGERWSYKTGIFSGDDSEEIGFSEVGGYFGLFSLGHDLSAMLGLDEASLRVDYVYNDKDEDQQGEGSGPDENNATPDFRHTTSLVTHARQRNWELHTEVAAGRGIHEQSNLWGLVVMPSYSFSQYHQVVLRYSHLDSSDDNGIRFGRYDRELASGRGDRYDEFYIGYNLYFYGQKLKWQTGLQYTRMRDDADDEGEYKGWGLTTGMRMYW